MPGLSETRLVYEHKAVLVDSQEMHRTPEYDYNWGREGQGEKVQSAWGVKSIEYCANHWSRLGWEHYQTIEVAGHDHWRPNNYAKHGFLLLFRRPVG